MTIRRSLLVAFLTFSIVFAVAMTALAYSQSRAALSAEIKQTLETQASTLTQQIEVTLFERIKDLQGWRRLDLMQDLKVGDVDKRLSRFLSDIKSAYAGMYREILCATDGRVVASSNAGLIGAAFEPGEAWLRLDVSGGEIVLERPDPLAANPEMRMLSALSDAFSEQPLGELAATFNWSEIVELLDNATANSGRYALLLDRELRPIAVSSGLRRSLAERSGILRKWPAADFAHGVFDMSAPAMHLDDLLAGTAHTAGYRGMPDLGWSVIVLTPVATAFAAIHELLIALVTLLAGGVLIAAIIATRLSTRTARPIRELTEFTREIGAQIETPARDIRGSREVEELSRAFNRMIEDLKRSRDRLVRVSKLATVGEMAAKLAHEVRTPLGIIRSSAELLDRQSGLQPRSHEMLNYMVSECDRINQLVTGLLESARPRQPVFEPHELNSIIAHVAELMSAKLEDKDLHLELPERGAVIPIQCDRAQMIQILLNLLMNASQILPAGGHIKVSSRIAGDEAELTVEDDGPGIPAGSREEIFEPLVSNRDGGIGLGLSIVREIVTMHSGTLEVRDGSLGGACFCIRLPLSHEGK